MAYPEVFLTRRMRRAIMGGFIAMFFIIAPLTILYTAGYRYDLSSGRIEQTGVLSIDIAPRDAEIYLNTARVRGDIPMRLANRAPGTYHLTIKKDGYHPWEKDITIGSKQTTYIKNITLLRRSSPVRVPGAASGSIITMAPSGDGAYIFLTRAEGTLATLELLDVRTKKRLPVERASLDAAPSVAWSPWYNLAAILSRTKTGTTIELFDPADEKTVQTISVSEPIGELSFEWRQNPDTAALFVRHGGSITRIGRNAVERTGVLPETVSAWHVEEGGSVWTFDRETNTIAVSDAPAGETYAPPSRVKRIVHVNKNRIIAAGDDSVMILPRTASLGAANEVRAAHVRVNPATGEWYAWSSSELWSIYEDGGSVLLNRTGERIVSVLPLDEYGELLFATEHAMTAFNPGYYVRQELVTGASIETTSVNPRLRTVSFLGTVNGARDLYELAY